jgi:hypothetical protein
MTYWVGVHNVGRELHHSYVIMQQQAYDQVALARKEGRILSQPCEVCGNPYADAHHEDYSKPLELRYLCTRHHMQYHRKRHGKVASLDQYVSQAKAALKEEAV